jgi:hypothetical protein
MAEEQARRAADEAREKAKAISTRATEAATGEMKEG